MIAFESRRASTTAFGVEPYIRLAFGNWRENLTLAIDRLAEALRRLR